MNIKVTLLYFVSVSVLASVSPEECVGVNNVVGMDMYISMVHDLKIDRSTTILSKTKAEIIALSSVNTMLANYYGEEERQRGGKNSDDRTTAKEYAEGFMADNTKNLIIRYTFENRSQKRNIFLASAFVSDTDCAVRFNGYIIVRREF